jgi:hypothetical protein
MRARKRAATAALATAALGLGVSAAPAAAEPTEPAQCHGQNMKFFAGDFGPGGFRDAAEFFFGDQPKAVQMGQRDIKFFCATEGGVP